MEKHFYNAASLAGVLRALEDDYGIASADFYKAHVDNDDSVVGAIPPAHRQAWVGFYTEWQRMSARDEERLREAVRHYEDDLRELAKT